VSPVRAFIGSTGRRAAALFASLLLAGCQLGLDVGENLDHAVAADLAVIPDLTVSVDAALPIDASDGGGGFDASPCPVDYIRCGAECVDPVTDILHCGGCSVRCSVGMQVCILGFCYPCVAGFACNNACVHLQTDPAHCGACSHQCGAAQTCVAGICK
jgi:hypothetical protein